MPGGPAPEGYSSNVCEASCSPRPWGSPSGYQESPEVDPPQTSSGLKIRPLGESSSGSNGGPLRPQSQGGGPSPASGGTLGFFTNPCHTGPPASESTDTEPSTPSAYRPETMVPEGQLYEENSQQLTLSQFSDNSVGRHLPKDGYSQVSLQ